jgi:hypothetical protein
MDYADESSRDPMLDMSRSETPDINGVTNRVRPGERFRTELAQALQIVASHERDRLTADVTADAERQIEWTRSRGAVEVDELRKLAEDDAAAIKAWSDDEIARIRAEEARRSEQRQADLADVLQRHEAMIEIEVEAVSVAVRTYESTLVEFFDDMTTSMDLVHIARQSDLIPEPPNLDIARADARAAAMSRLAQEETATPPDESNGRDDGLLVGVMDPEAIGSTSDLAEELSDSPSESQDDAVPATDDAIQADDEGTTEEDEQTVVSGIAESVAPANAAARFLRTFGLSTSSPEAAPGQTNQPQ